MLTNRQKNNLIASTAPTPEDLAKIMNVRLDKFYEYVETLKDVDEGTLSLWTSIYEQALEDRQNSYRLYHDLWMTMQGDLTAHTMNGQIIARYVERMSKANDQMLQLATLMRESIVKETGINPDDIFNAIAENSVQKAK